MSTIRCFYECNACQSGRQWVEVPERDPKTHDVLQWMEQVLTPHLVLHHHARSALCRPSKFDAVGIPVGEGTEHVGEKTRS